MDNYCITGKTIHFFQTFFHLDVKKSLYMRYFAYRTWQIQQAKADSGREFVSLSHLQPYLSDMTENFLRIVKALPDRVFHLPVFFYIIDSLFLRQGKFIHDISDCIYFTDIKIPAGPYSRTNAFKDTFPSAFPSALLSTF